MRERILAVVGAVGLIAAAILVRSLIAGDDGSDGADPSGSADAPVVACTPDLRAVCEALADEGLITGTAPLDLAGATAPDPSVEGWITWDTAPGVANVDSPATWVGDTVLASAPLGVLVAEGAVGCGAASTWASCVVAGAEGGAPVGVGVPTTAQGLARLHPVAAALVPSGGDFTDISPVALRRVVDSPQVGQSDQRRQLAAFVTQRGALRVVVGPVPALQATASRTAATVVTPSPNAEMTVVVTTAAAHADDLMVMPPLVLESEGARAALEELGLTPGTGTLPPDQRYGEAYAIRGHLS